jgi:hypothetical protein
VSLIGWTAMHLTEEQARQVRTSPEPVELLDPTTQQAYVLLAREQYERVRTLLAGPTQPPAPGPETAIDIIPPGILRSQQAYWNDLPELLGNPSNHGKWVCYHDSERIGIGHTQRQLIRECLRRGLPDDAYYTDIIEPRSGAPWEVEEIEARGDAFEEEDGEPPFPPGQPT